MVEQKGTKVNAKIGKTYISNRVDLSPSQPIPFENNSSAFSYLNDRKYIPFLAGNDGNFDRYGKMLLEARLTSTTHNACITTKRNYCAGNGFRHIADEKLDPRFVEWMGNVNLKNEPVTEISKQTFEGYYTYGNAPIELVRFTVGGKRYFFVYVHNFLKWRLATPENDIVTRAMTSELFIQGGAYLLDSDLNKARSLPIYNPRNSDRQNWQKEADGTERTLIWYKHSVSGFDHYGVPSSISSVMYQLLEYKAARFNLDNFENNMVLSALLVLKGNVSQGEANRIAGELIKTHTGDGKRGRVMAVASEEGINNTEFHQMNSVNDGSYTESGNMWDQKIIIANQWDATMMGILSPSTLGKGSGYITKIVERINKDVITPDQKDCYSKVWIKIFKLVKEWMGFNIDENKIEIDNQVDISGLTDIDITPAVQVNEVRKAKSLPEDPAMKGVYMNAAKTTQEKTPAKGGENV